MTEKKKRPMYVIMRDNMPVEVHGTREKAEASILSYCKNIIAENAFKSRMEMTRWNLEWKYTLYEKVSDDYEHPEEYLIVEVQQG